MSATQKELKKAVVELNEVLGCDPEINPKGTPEQLVKGIKAAIKLITPADEFTSETEKVLAEFQPAGKAKAEAPAKKGKAAPVVEDDDEDEDEDDDEDEDEDDEDNDEPATPVKKSKVAPATVVEKKSKKAPVVEEDDEDEDEDDEPVVPAKKSKKAPIVDEDEDEDEDEAPVKKSKKGKETPAKKEKKSKEEIFKGPGIIKTIQTLLEGSGKKGMSIDEIHKALIVAFPDRDAKSMLNTVRVQVPGRISKEKFELEKLSSGNYRKKVAKA